MPDKSNIVIAILAAGNSSRMGSIKQLLPWKDSTLIEHTINQSIESLASSTMLILGANAKEIERRIDGKSVEIVYNENWASGMLSSIQKSIISLDDLTDAILFILADQPAVDANYLNQIISRFHDTSKSIIATHYKTNNGVPALFSKAHFKNLIALKKDKGGAKKYIGEHMNEVDIIKPDFELYDIDTKEDYRNYHSS